MDSEAKLSERVASIAQSMAIAGYVVSEDIQRTVVKQFVEELRSGEVQRRIQAARDFCVERVKE